jgi:cytochrome c peroxidase
MVRRMFMVAVFAIAACGTQNLQGGEVGDTQLAAMIGAGGMGGGGGGGMGGEMPMMDPSCMGLMGGGGGMGGGGMGGDKMVMLGRMLFCDMRLSANGNQSCASCHAPQTGFAGASSEINLGSGIYPGSVPGKIGDRKPPSAAYATPSPVFHYDADEGVFIGGLFWDGRATGARLGDPAAEQALGPYTNPNEQALPDSRAVVQKVCAATYGNMFRSMFGAAACSSLADDATIATAFDNLGRAVSAFEASSAVNRYSSKYDKYLRGEATLTSLERRGLQLFEGKARCALCHPTESQPDGNPPLLTDNTFDNLGLPKNPNHPYGPSFVDPGLGGSLDAVPEYDDETVAHNKGKHRVPTLRNADKRPAPDFVKAYGHNGYFKTLKEIVHFYNTRDVLPFCDAVTNGKVGQTCWPRPEYEPNVNRDELGNLKLTEHDEDALVAFLKTLSDE